MTQTKLSPTDTRLAFIKEVTAPLEAAATAILVARDACGVEIPDMDIEGLTEIATRMSADGHLLGRTSGWKNACRWAEDEIASAKIDGKLTREHARWAVLQGAIWMGMAA